VAVRGDRSAIAAKPDSQMANAKLSGSDSALDYRAYPVLYVDDEPSNLVSFRYAMERHFTVLTASSGEEALRVLLEQDVAVLVADQRMPGMSGIELCQRARQDKPETIRMIMTAYADLHVAVDAINHGHVSRYLSKPWRNDDLLEVLRAAIELVHVQRSVQHLEMRLLRSGQSTAATSVYDELLHELSNPLGSLDMNASLLAEQLASALEQLNDPIKARAALLSALETQADLGLAVAALKALVVRVRQGRRPAPPVAPASCDAVRVVDATSRIVRAELEKVGRFELIVDASRTLTLAIEASVLGQVVLNVLLNAAQALRPETKARNLITIRVGQAEGCGQILVRDNGPGIPADELERVFDPFFTTKATGTGLGLSICKDLISRAHGTIEVQSAPNQGATFTITLPLAHAGRRATL
jgi:two-component system, NtrC family, sensor kinase